MFLAQPRLKGRTSLVTAHHHPPPYARIWDRVPATVTVIRVPRITAATAAFTTTVVAANLLTNHVGLVGVGFGMRATAGTVAAGLTLLARDWVHHTAGRRWVLACIGVGALASALLATPRLALASAATFGLSELADLLVYQRLYARGWALAAVGSNTVGAPVDTIVFLAMAGFPVWAAAPGQLWVKALATIIPVALVACCRALLRHRLRPPGR